MTVKRLATIVGAAVILAACTSSEVAGVTLTTLPTPTTVPGLDATGWAEEHLVRVRAAGNMIDDPVTQQATGIVIRDGYVVVPATAVIGATNVGIWFSGSDTPMAGSVIGSSQCDNLAVIGVDTARSNVVTIAPEGTSAAAATFVDGETWGSGPAPSAAPGSVLIDRDGHVIGVVGSTGLVPVATIDTIVQRIISFDTGPQPGLAVHPVDGGLLVTGTEPDGPAGATDLHPGDVIVDVDGAPAVSLDPVCGGQPSLIVDRDGQTLSGTFGVEALGPTSRRTTDELRRAVVRVEAIDGSRGTGFFIDPAGLLVTNHHVIAGTDVRAVTFDGGTESAAGNVVGRSSCSDLALIQVQGSGFEYLEWASSPPALEQPVRSIGFPLGVDEITIERGIVSKQSVTPYSSMRMLPEFQHSAQIIGGSSGGPIVDDDESVIGVVRAGRDEGAAALNYAISGTEAQEVVEMLRGGDHLDLGGVFYPQFGDWLVGPVDPGSPLDDFGLEADDLVISVNDGEIVENMTQFVCSRVRAGESVYLEVARGSTLLDGVLGAGTLQPVPEPFVVSDEAGVRTLVPGRWTGFSLITDETQGENDWGGLRAFEPGWSLAADAFWYHPFMVALYSYERADTETTQSALGDYGCDTTSDAEQTSVNGLRGHRRASIGCGPLGFNVVDYAVVDNSGARPIMLEITIGAPPHMIDDADALITGGLDFRPPPPPDD